MKLRWSLGARDDLAAINAFIAADDPAAAQNWIERLHARAMRAAAVPGIGRRVPEYARGDVREVLVRTYRIIYLVQPGTVFVLAVREGHQRLPPLPNLLARQREP